MEAGHLLKEAWKGRSLGRAIQNAEFAGIELRGRGIDLGASTNSGSYYEFIRLHPDAVIEYTDLIPKGPNVTVLDLEQPLPLASESKDFVIINNVLHAIYNYRQCIGECHRILKPGGEILGVIPFFHILDPDPNDYFRYTESSLKRIFVEAGFGDVSVRPLGYGVFSACANAWATMLRLHLLKYLAYLIGIGLDKAVAGLSGLLFPKGARRGEVWSGTYFPIYYMFHCKK